MNISYEKIMRKALFIAVIMVPCYALGSSEVYNALLNKIAAMDKVNSELNATRMDLEYKIGLQSNPSFMPGTARPVQTMRQLKIQIRNVEQKIRKNAESVLSVIESEAGLSVTERDSLRKKAKKLTSLSV